MEFREYWNKHCPTACKKQAMKMYHQYLEVSKASTDMKDKETMEYPFGTWYLNANFNSSLAPLPQVECTVPCKSACVPQKKEKTMYVDNDKHITSSKINYLQSRIESIFFKKDGELRKQFGLINDETPETAVELVKRILDGKFTIKDEYKEKRTYGDAARYITWRDPAVKEDKVGYEAALKTFQGVHQSTLDTVALYTDVDVKVALEAVKSLEAWSTGNG